MMEAVEQGLIKFEPQRTDLQTVFKTAEVLFAERLRQRDMRIVFPELRADNRFVMADPRILANHVFSNLVSNAIKYTPQGGEVYLSLGIVGGNARLIVRDTGQGISAEDLPHIFERFFRAEKSRTRTKISGFGLGLSIAYWIVNHHGGRIEVDSAENKGSTFCIYLPMLKTSEPPVTE